MSSHAEILSLAHVLDARGQLVFIEDCMGDPFAIEQVIWGVNAGRGLGRDEIIIAVTGTIDVHVECPASEQKVITLTEARQALYLSAASVFWFRAVTAETITLRIIGLP